MLRRDLDHLVEREVGLQSEDSIADLQGLHRLAGAHQEMPTGTMSVAHENVPDTVVMPSTALVIEADT